LDRPFLSFQIIFSLMITLISCSNLIWRIYLYSLDIYRFLSVQQKFFFFFVFWHYSSWWTLASSKFVLHSSRSWDFRLQFLKPLFFRPSSSDPSRLNLGFNTRRVSSVLSRVSFLQGSSSPKITPMLICLLTVETIPRAPLPYSLSRPTDEFAYSSCDSRLVFGLRRPGVIKPVRGKNSLMSYCAFFV